jgi:chaperonin cofactor prefoldin
MTDVQLYLAVGLPVFAFLLSIAVSVVQTSSIQARITSVETGMSGRLTSVEASMSARFTSLESNINARFSSVDARLNSLENRFETLTGKVVEMDNRLTRVKERLSRP